MACRRCEAGQETAGGSEWATKVPAAAQWAQSQFGQVKLGDERRERRAVVVATMMAENPEGSLPAQMESKADLHAAYRFLSNPEVSMEALLAQHQSQTLAAARQVPLVLMVEDSTELDYTKHRSKEDLGPIGDGRGRGLVLHETLAVVPGPTRQTAQLLGMAYLQVVLRTPAPASRPHASSTPEAKLWQRSAQEVGAPPEEVRWVHVSDRGSDVFEYMVECCQQGKEFVIRSQHNRRLEPRADDAEVDGERVAHLHDYARSLSAREGISFSVTVDKTKTQPAREATVVVGWGQVSVTPPPQGSQVGREYGPLTVSVVRAWEPEAPEGAPGVEWLLLTSVAVESADEAMQIIEWYRLRWWCEDFHKCLKSGCKVERAQLNEADDIRRLLGILTPVAVRMLQVRQAARLTPDLPAASVVEPLMVEVLARRQKVSGQGMTIGQFWSRVARMGGHLGRKSDGPAGWQTLWRGWRRLVDLTEGARLFLTSGPVTTA